MCRPQIHVLLRVIAEKYPSVKTSLKHYDIDSILEEVSAEEKWPPRTKNKFLDLATACRKIQAEMSSIECMYHRDGYPNIPGNICQYNQLLPTLNLLQRQAYFEIKSNVLLANRTRMLTELIQLILEETLVAEGISKDPRVIMWARHLPCETPRIRELFLLCLRPCEYDFRESECARDSKKNRCGGCKRLLFGIPHEAILPQIPHNLNHFEYLENEELDATHEANCGEPIAGYDSGTDGSLASFSGFDDEDEGEDEEDNAANRRRRRLPLKSSNAYIVGLQIVTRKNVVDGPPTRYCRHTVCVFLH